MEFSLLILALMPMAILSEPHWLKSEATLDRISTAAEYIVELLGDVLTEDGNHMQPRYPHFDDIASLVNTFLPLFANITIPKIGNETVTMGLYLENIFVQGIENIQFILISDPDLPLMDNFTFYIPEISINADRYFIKDVDLDIIRLDGEGVLSLSLQGFTLHTKMDFKTNEADGLIYPQNVKELSLGLNSAKFALTNLGNSGEAVADLLNSIASSVLPLIINGANADIQSAIQDPAGWSSMLEPAFCGVYGIIFNSVICLMHGDDDDGITGCASPLKFGQFMCET